MKTPKLWKFCIVLIFGLSVRMTIAAAPLYDLHRVGGMDQFGGSAAAKQLLADNGFVVANPSFKQIFQPYIQSPLPVFITPDSAWHTYHVLLEEGVKEMETTQSRRLAQFSRLLWNAANDQVKDGRPEFGQIATYAAVGLAFQDRDFCKSLPPATRQIVEALLNGSEPVPISIGFPLSPGQFRAQSFYTESSALTEYFAARQWYASVVFRLSDAKETRLALCLSWLIENDQTLADLWNQLSKPYDAFLAPSEDATVKSYEAAALAVIGTHVNPASIEAHIGEVSKKLAAQLPAPRINDQLLSPAEYKNFAKVIKGFRLLPPRQLPSAICFQNTTDPAIPGRMFPSGLDFMVASPVLRSPAAIRALKKQSGTNVTRLIEKVDCGEMPDSLHGEAMTLLATLEKPLPKQSPPVFQTPAWADQQLWTQLGAWAEQRHTWALHTKLNVEYMGLAETPVGIVAPYPEFFSGLAKLSRRTADAFEKAGLQEHFDVKTVANQLLQQVMLFQKAQTSANEEEMAKMSDELDQFSRFQQRYYEKHHAEFQKDRTLFDKLPAELEALARRCASTGQTNTADLETLHLFFDSRQNVTHLFSDFAPVCDRLAELAQKQLDGKPLTEDESNWVKDYGITLAGFNFYGGNSWLDPRDDFPIVTRIYDNPAMNSVLYAGLARPQAIYVVAPANGKLILYRGAVMTYREFTRPADQLLDDDSWRAIVKEGKAAPVPSFTQGFYAETSAAELIKNLRARMVGAYVDDVRDTLFQLGSRATDKDLPALIDLMANAANDEGNRNELVDGTADLITNLNWAPYQKQLLKLMAGDDEEVAHAAAYIFLQNPQALDPAPLTSGFGHFSPRARRLDCVVLSGIPDRTGMIQGTLLRALRDDNDGVRWQAALAIGDSGRGDQQIISALVNRLNDTNQFVVAAASRALGQLGATNTAPAMFSELKKRLRSASVDEADWERQSKAVQSDKPKFNGSHIDVLDADNLEFKLRSPGMLATGLMLGHPIPSFNAISAIVTTLGQFQHHAATEKLFTLLGGGYDLAAVEALKQLAPEELTRRLFASAKDSKADSTSRARSLADLSFMDISDRVNEFLPLLDDTTPVHIGRMPPGREWRICDQTAQTVATLLKRHVFMSPLAPIERRDQIIKEVREWLTQVPTATN